MFSFRKRGGSRPLNSVKPNHASRAHQCKIEALEDRTVPAVLTVTSAADDGDGSLRDAVAKANVLEGADTIQFDALLDGSAVNLSTGEILVTDDLSIIGRGTTLTGVTSNNTSRLFNAEAPGKAVVLAFSEISLVGAQATGDGGVIRLAGGSLVLSRTLVAGGVANRGGGVAVLNNGDIAGVLQAYQAVIAENKAGVAGGGVFVSSTFAGPSGWNVSIDSSNVSENLVTTPTGAGAGIGVESGVVIISNTTLADNISTGAGGAIESGSAGHLWLQNTTITENASTAGLGGGAILSRGDLSILNSTIVANGDTSGNGIGGVRHLGTAPAKISSSIIAENTGASGAVGNRDVQSSTPIASDGHNLFGQSSGLTGVLGTDLVNVSPNLGPLAYNGGFTPTKVPLPDSPVIGKGSNQAGLTTDQRGTGYRRLIQGKADIGSVQFNQENEAPTALLTAAPELSVGSSAFRYDFTIRFTDSVNINLSTLDGSDILVTGPNGYSQKATLTATDKTVVSTEINAQYTIAPATGGWTINDNGDYTITLLPNQVYDLEGRPIVAQVLGTFKIALHGDNLGFTRSLYRTILGRDGDSDGLRDYQARLNAGETRESIVREIWQSDEHREIQVSQYYREILGRDADADGLAYWVDRFLTGASEEEVIAGITGSKERLEQTGAVQGLSNFVFDHLLGRSAGTDAAEFEQRATNGSATDAVKDLALSDEALTRRMNELYDDILLRDADEAGRNWFVEYSREKGGYGEAAIQLLASAEYYQLHGTAI